MKREKRTRELMPARVQLPVALQKAIVEKAFRENQTVSALVRRALQKEFGFNSGRKIARTTVKKRSKVE